MAPRAPWSSAKWHWRCWAGQIRWLRFMWGLWFDGDWMGFEWWFLMEFPWIKNPWFLGELILDVPAMNFPRFKNDARTCCLPCPSSPDEPWWSARYFGPVAPLVGEDVGELRFLLSDFAILFINIFICDFRVMFSHVRSCFFDFRVNWTVIFRFEIVKTLILLEDEPINGKPRKTNLNTKIWVYSWGHIKSRYIDRAEAWRDPWCTTLRRT